jgi:predicted transcriptional regulator
LEIIYSILRASTEGVIKTHIMFKCNLNSTQLQLYVQFLVDKGLLSRERVPPSPKILYKTSERGRKFVRTYEALLETVGTKSSERVELSA